MSYMPTLKTLMTPFPYAIDVEASLTQAESMMTEHAIRHLPVTENGQLVGVLADRDLHRARQDLGDDPREHHIWVREVYRREAYIVDFDERLDTVLLRMAEQHIGSALVTRRGKLVGIFTAVDACQGFGDYLRAQFPSPPDDEIA